MGVVLALPDLHAPFIHRDAGKFCDAVATAYKPDVVIQLGDLADQHHYSRHPVSTKGEGGRSEISDAAKQLKEFTQLFPKMHVCWGNHDLRIYTRARDSGIDDSIMPTYNELLRLPVGWKIADRWVVDGVVYEHGIGRGGSQGALKAAMANMQSTVIGHIHAHAGVHYYANKDKLIFGLNCGSLADEQKYAFEYARFSSSKGILGCGVIINGIPVFIPMILNKNGRWIGRLF